MNLSWFEIAGLIIMATVVGFLGYTAWKKHWSQRGGRPQPTTAQAVPAEATGQPPVPSPQRNTPNPQVAKWMLGLKVFGCLLAVLAVIATWRCGTYWAGADRAGHRHGVVEGPTYTRLATNTGEVHRITLGEEPQCYSFDNVPWDMKLVIGRVHDDAKYEVKTPFGRHEMLPGENNRIPGSIPKACFRSLSGKPEEIWIDFVPKYGAPKAPTPEEPEDIEEDVPPLEDGIPEEDIGGEAHEGAPEANPDSPPQRSFCPPFCGEFRKAKG